MLQPRPLLGVFLAALLWGAEAERPPAGRLSFRSYGTDQGLTNPSVTCLAQDAQGFLWVGTMGGLFRYGGLRFEAFGPNEGLPSPRVQALRVDREGTLWVSTSRGIARLRGGRFVALAGGALPAGGGLAEDAEGHLWAATAEGPLRREEGRGFQADPTWPGGPCTALVLARGGLLAARGGELLRRGEGGWALQDRLPAPDIVSLVEDRRGRLWAASTRELWVRRSPGRAFEPLSRRLPAPFARWGALFLDAQGRVWIPTRQGVVKVDGDRWDVLNAARGLPTPWVQRVLVDREGSLWVGSAGVHRLLGEGRWESYSQRDGLPSDMVYTVLGEGGGRLWVGTDQGLVQGTPRGWAPVAGTQGRAIHQVVQTRDGALWMASEDRGLERMDPRTHRIERVPWEGRPLIHSMLPDGEGLLAGTLKRGLHQVRREAGGFRVEACPLPEAPREEFVSTLHAGARGRVWLATAKGLLCREGGRWRRFGSLQGLRSEDVMAAVEPRPGEVWVAYWDFQGLSCFAYEGGRLSFQRQLTTAQGLPSDQVYGLLADGEGRVWAGTARGVGLLDAQGRVHAFGTGEGLPGEDCNSQAMWVGAEGSFWIGTTQGLGRFDAREGPGEGMAPTVALLGIRRDGVLHGAPGPSRALVLPSTRGATEFLFTTPSFLNEARVRHRIRLRGLEEAWRELDLPQAPYPALPPGRYEFEVQARAGLGPWGPSTRCLLEIRPAWWQTRWFRGLAALGGLLAFGAAWRWRHRALGRRNQELEALVRARTEKLERANEALSRLSMSDPLTGLFNRRYLELTLPEDIARVRRTFSSGAARSGNHSLLFMMLDVDHFKMVNDVHGHGAGDLVLLQIRDLLLGTLRATDTVVRWGGEEFLIVARDADPAYASDLATRICETIRRHTFDLGNGHPLRKTCSLGFALFPTFPGRPEALDWLEAVELADRSLYVAKHSGRDAWVGLLGVGGAPEDVRPRLKDPPRLLEEGHLRMFTSFPPTQPLIWE